MVDLLYHSFYTVVTDSKFVGREDVAQGIYFFRSRLNVSRFEGETCYLQIPEDALVGVVSSGYATNIGN